MYIYIYIEKCISVYHCLSIDLIHVSFITWGCKRMKKWTPAGAPNRSADACWCPPKSQDVYGECRDFSAGLTVWPVAKSIGEQTWDHTPDLLVIPSFPNQAEPRCTMAVTS